MQFSLAHNAIISSFRPLSRSDIIIISQCIERDHKIGFGRCAAKYNKIIMERK